MIANECMIASRRDEQAVDISLSLTKYLFQPSSKLLVRSGVGSGAKAELVVEEIYWGKCL